MHMHRNQLRMKSILLVFGTRPEAIKMAPLYHELSKSSFEVKVCVTGQHREMLDQVLEFFQIEPDYDLNLMKANQSLNGLSARVLQGIDQVLVEEKPDCVLVHGDTTTSSMVALAAFHRNIKVGHVEAGLRTFDKSKPFPEELNRQLTGRIADFHFSPTSQAFQNLIEEKIDAKAIHLVGNTVIDALLWASNKIDTNYSNRTIDKLSEQLDPDKKLILVTGHRRESFGDGFINLCEALLVLSKRTDVEIIYPVHLNPNVEKPVKRLLSNHKNIHLIKPCEYAVFIWLMKRSYLIISDSGGVQEEAPSLGKPVLVTRTVTERHEGVAKGFSKLVGTNKEKIIFEANTILNNFSGFKNEQNPYGKGDSSEQIVEVLRKFSIND